MIPLSDRQLTILRYISDGFNNKDIARYLGLSVETIKSHRSCILQKLNAANSANAVAIALREGMME